MEPCVLIASACDSISPDQIVKGILEKDDLPEPLELVEGVLHYPWHIDNKYYDADVHVCAMNKKTLGTQAFANSVNAVILCFDSSSESKLETVEQWLSFTKEFEAEIKILICDQCHSNDFHGGATHNQSPESQKGVSKFEAQKWCVGNGFELVELNPDQSEEDSDVEDDFPESLGMKRVIQALHAHIWPNLRMKSSSSNNNNNTHSSSNNLATDRNSERNINALDSMLENNLDSMSGDTFEQLFLDLSTMKSKASKLSPTQRKEFAEKMAISFWKSIGGDDAEINLDSSDDEGVV